ncbi:MAG: hypothetical protein D6753_09680 [Planctomycetota bacterium]|nr:MAG: hypothetical protein D6753_09680 [Planctomycetota bacterium]
METVFRGTWLGALRLECPEVRDRLSAYFDGELAPDQRSEIALHVERCPLCAEELRGFTKLSELVAAVQPDSQAADCWSDVVAQLERGRPTPPPPAVPLGRGALRSAALAASVVLAVIAGTFAFQTWFGGHRHNHLAADLTRYAREFAENPGRAQRLLLATYDGQPLEIQQVGQRLNYEPTITRSVPPGWKLKEVYLLHMPCCTCAQAILESEDGRCVAVFEHDTDQAMWFGDRQSIDCLCDGKPTSIVDMGGQLVGSWQQGNRTLTVIGARDLKDITQFVMHLSRPANG